MPGRESPGLSIDTVDVVLDGRFRLAIRMDRHDKRAPENLVECLIRSVEPTDLGSLCELIFESSGAVWSRARVSASLRSRAARVRVAEDCRADASVLQGFVVARRVADFLEIDLVGVRPAFRRRGLARSMLAALIEAEIPLGLAEVRLELAATNESARRLYEGLEFVVVGRRKRYYPDGDDALLLTRMISSS